MMNLLHLSTAFCALLSAISLGGGLYEVSVVDPFWPGNPSLIQPKNGGIDRKRFWIPSHVAFEATLIVALWLAWSDPAVRFPLVVAFASHLTMRCWSFVEFIPKALSFERAETWSVDGLDALRWVKRSKARLLLDALTVGASLVALINASNSQT